MLEAQNQYNNYKNDYIWMLGYVSPNPDSLFGGAIIDFHNYPTKAYRKNVLIKIGQSFVSYCDNKGNLILTSNGREITDSTLNIMDNGAGLEVGLTGYKGNAGNQATLVLDWPNDTNKLAVIYSDTYYEEYKYVCSYNLFYSVIDKKGNNGLGKVIEKNNKVFSHTLSPSHLTACRHANGKDWWIVKQSIYTDTIFKFLLSNEGINYMGFQKVSIEKNIIGLGQSIFSPDGKKFVAFHGVNDNLRYFLSFNFDRCSGIFSNRNYFFFRYCKSYLWRCCYFTKFQVFVYCIHKLCISV